VSLVKPVNVFSHSQQFVGLFRIPAARRTEQGSDGVTAEATEEGVRYFSRDYEFVATSLEVYQVVIILDAVDDCVINTDSHLPITQMPSCVDFRY